MSRVRVHNFSVSLDGFGTGEGQSPAGYHQRVRPWKSCLTWPLSRASGVDA